MFFLRWMLSTWSQRRAIWISSWSQSPSTLAKVFCSTYTHSSLTHCPISSWFKHDVTPQYWSDIREEFLWSVCKGSLCVVSLDSWKTWGNQGGMLASVRPQVTVKAFVFLCVCTSQVINLQSTEVLKKRNSCVCCQCTLGRDSSSSGRRSCCHPLSGTGKRQCFPEDHSWKGIRPLWVGSLLPLNLLAIWIPSSSQRSSGARWQVNQGWCKVMGGMLEQVCSVPDRVWWAHSIDHQPLQNNESPGPPGIGRWALVRCSTSCWEDGRFDNASPACVSQTANRNLSLFHSLESWSYQSLYLAAAAVPQPCPCPVLQTASHGTLWPHISLEYNFPGQCWEKWLSTSPLHQKLHAVSLLSGILGG